MLKKWFSTLAAFEKAIVCLSVVFIVIGVVRSASYVNRFGGTDLRSRVVGARLLHSGHSPYFYKWQPGDPDRLADPCARKYGIDANPVTVSPGFLYFQSLFTWMPYRAIKISWAIFQYLLCLSILVFFLSMKNSTTPNKLFALLIGSIFFLCSAIWFYNIEAGQAYIIFAWSLCLLYWLYARGKGVTIFAAGAFCALVCFVRLNFILVALPLVLTFDKRFIGGLLSMGAILLAPVWLDLGLWKEYYTAMGMHFNIEVPGSIILQEPVTYPAIIEGADNIAAFEAPDAGGFPTLKYLFLKLHLHYRYLYTLLYAIIAAVLLYYFRKSIRQKEPRTLLLIGFLLYIISEYCMPAMRMGYNLVQWIFPVLFILQSRQVTKFQILLMVTGLCLVVSFPVSMRFTHSGGEMLMIWALIDHIAKGSRQSSI